MTIDWPSVQISEACELIVDCVNKTAPVVDGPTPYKMIRTTNVRDGWVDTESVRYVEEDVYKQWIRRGAPKRGDVILTREAPLGEVGLLRDDRGIFLGQRLVMYRANPKKLDNRFLLYSLLHHDLQGQIKAFGSGSTVEHMRVPDCEKLILKLPPLETQRKIASILSAYDDLIENNTRRIKILEEMAQAIYREWFVNFRFPGHEKVRMVDSPIGRVPEGWEVKPLAGLCESIDYGFTASAKREEIGPKFLRITDVVPSYIDWDSVPFCSIEEKKLGKLLLREGDIVIARTGATVGYAKRLHKRHPNAVFASYLVRLRLKPEVDNLMVGIFVESEVYKTYVLSHAGGAAQPNANAKVLAGAEMLVPPSQIQSNFHEFVEPLFDQKEILQIQNKNLRQTRDLLQPKLIAGEVDVSNLDFGIKAD